MNSPLNTLSLNKNPNGNVYTAASPLPTQLAPVSTVIEQVLKPQGNTGSAKADAALTRKKFDQKEIDLLKSKLLEAPTPPREFGKLDVLEELLETLKDLTKRGHSRDQIRALLSSQGLDFSARQIAETISKISASKSKTVSAKSPA